MKLGGYTPRGRRRIWSADPLTRVMPPTEQAAAAILANADRHHKESADRPNEPDQTTTSTSRATITELELKPYTGLVVVTAEVPRHMMTPSTSRMRIEFEAPIGAYQIGDQIEVAITRAAAW